MTNQDFRQLSHSQNFLVDEKFVAKLAERAHLSKSDVVVEIGPGDGIITSQLAKIVNEVFAIEADQTLSEKLRRDIVPQFLNVKVIETDFLKWPLPKIPYKVFSNIPFNTTTDILDKLLTNSNPPSETYLIMQEEAAKRFVGKPFAKVNNLKSILLQPWYKMAVLELIDRKEFRPTPRVNAVIALFKKREDPLIKEELKQRFNDFLIYGFSKWSPTVLKACDKIFTRNQSQKLGQDLGIERSKPSELTLENWLYLFNFFLANTTISKQALIAGSETALKQQQDKLQKWHRTRRSKTSLY